MLIHNTYIHTHTNTQIHNLTFGDGVVLGHPAGEHGVLAQPVDLGKGADPLGMIMVTTMKTMVATNLGEKPQEKLFKAQNVNSQRRGNRRFQKVLA